MTMNEHKWDIKNKQLAALIHAGNIINSTLDLREVLRLITEEVVKVRQVLYICLIKQQTSLL